MAKAYIKGPPFEPSEDLPASLASYIHDLVRVYPDGEYVEIDKQGSPTVKPYRVLYQRALVLAREIEQWIPQDSSRFAVICLESALDFIPAAWACLFSDVNCVPWSIEVSVRNKSEFVREIDALLQKLHNPLILTDHPTRKLLVDSLGSNYTPNIIDIDDLPTGAEPDLTIASPSSTARHPSDFLISTSGTTGRPKLAVLNNRTVVNRFFSSVEPDNNGVSLYCLPHNTVTGIRLLIPNRKQIVYLQPSRLVSNTVELLAIIERYRVTSFGTTSFFAALINDAIERSDSLYDLSRVASLGVGAEIIVPDVLSKLICNFHKLGMKGASVCLTYGMTEGGPICSSRLLANDLLELISDETRPLAIGEGCVSGWELRIVDESGHQLNEDQVGRIEIRSDSKLFAGYYKEPELNEAFFMDNGWFYTGDLGQVEEGKLRVTGREKETLIVNARKISCEQIEAPLRELDGLHLKTVMAASYRHAGSVTDELAVFFVPESFKEDYMLSLGRCIVSVTARNVGLRVRQLVAVPESEFTRTSTGKIQRREMVEQYRNGAWKNLIRLIEKSPQDQLILPGVAIARLWKDVLELAYLPLSNDNFFELGGDSLAAARLITRIEKEFKIEVPAGIFFEEPTLTRMSELIEKSRSVETNLATDHKFRTPFRYSPSCLVHDVEIFSRSWRGERLFEDSMVVGWNTAGSKRPLFWVFQNDRELQMLARKLGPEQPLYGMRSCARVIPPREYDFDILRPLVDRYLWEIMALSGDKSFVLGGNCQGAIVSLAIARRLKQITRAPVLLILMEWSYSVGNYTDPVLLIYGKESYTAKLYAELALDDFDWRSDFPNHIVCSILGEHGQFWNEPNIDELAGVIEQNMLALPGSR